MDKEIKREALKQYLHYFRFWFIGAGAALLLFLAAFAMRWVNTSAPRGNQNAPAERVYDYAEVLSGEEEEKLRQLIAKTEAKTHCDIVLVTISQEVGVSDSEWNNTMMNLADDFYDQNQYGYDRVHGDGVLLLDNWYEGQAGSWLSTCGRVYSQFSNGDINEVLRAVYDKVESSPYEAYCAYIMKISRKMSGEVPFPAGLLIIPVIVMLVFVFTKLKSPVGKETVAANTYVMGGRPMIRSKSDQLARKFVTKRHIPKPSSSGGGGGHSGGGGGHVSSGGVSHGGGGMRR